MLKKFKSSLLKNLKTFGLISLIIFTIIISILSNHKKKISENQDGNIIDNIYFKKTLNEIINNLEPKYKKINHSIKYGETFDKILSDYSIDKDEIIKIKNILKKKINLNKLNTKQSIQFSLDKTNNKISEFTFQISNTEKIYLKRNIDNNKFIPKILSIN